MLNTSYPQDRSDITLHMAVQLGKEDELSRLLQVGHSINSKNIKGETALHLAVKLGSIEMVEILLRYQADLSVKDPGGKTAAHYAVELSHGVILERLLNNLLFNDVNKLLSQTDHDLNTPLHYATLQSDPAIALFLIGKKANINAINKDNYMPLQLAVCKGNIPIVKILLEHSEDKIIKKLKLNKLAKKYNQLDLANLLKKKDPIALLGKKQCVKLPYLHVASLLIPGYDALMDEAKKQLRMHNTWQAKELLEKAYSLADKSNSLPAQILCLRQLAKVYLNHKKAPDFINAAKIANSALALYNNFRKKSPLWLAEAENQERKIFEYELVSIENKFIVSSINGRKVKEVSQEVLYKQQIFYKELLYNLRKQLESSVKDIHYSSEDLLKNTSELFVKVFAGMINDAITIIGIAPCDYAFISLGSMSRSEMSAYSDLEFAILIADDKPKYIDYFRKLTQWLEIKVINLGETKCITGKVEKRPEELTALSFIPVFPKTGFCFDSGGCTPNYSSLKLISTPKYLANMQQASEQNIDFLDLGRLNNVGYITGNASLVSQYENFKALVLKSQPRQDYYNVDYLHQYIALKLLNNDVRGDAPRLNRQKEKNPGFDIKHELYRLPSNVINGLALYYALPGKSIWEKLEQLHHHKIINDEGYIHLKTAIDAITRLRLFAHLFYGTEKEEIFPPHVAVNSDSADNQYLQMSDKNIDTIFEIYKVLLPLHKATIEFCANTKSDNVFLNNTFYSEDLETQGEAWTRLYKFDKSKECYQKMLAIDPLNSKALLGMSDILMYGDKNEAGEKGKELAWEYLTKAFLIGVFRMTSGQDIDDDVLRSQINLGALAVDFGEFEKAEIFLNGVLNYIVQQRGPFDPLFPLAMYNLTRLYMGKSDFNNAEQVCGSALAVIAEFENKSHVSYIFLLNQLSSIYIRQGRYSEAEEIATMSLAAGKQVLGADHVELAVTLVDLGRINVLSGSGEKGREYFEQAYLLIEKGFGLNHPQTAEMLRLLGTAYHKLSDFESAEVVTLKGLKIVEEVLGQDNIEYARQLTSLATIYEAAGKYDQAEKALLIALAIDEKINDGLNTSTANCYMRLGETYIGMKKYDQAASMLDKSLTILELFLAEDNPQIKFINSLKAKISYQKIQHEFLLAASNLISTRENKIDIKILAEAQARINLDNFEEIFADKMDWTLLHLAAASGHMNIISLLHYIDINTTISGGLTALHVAVNNNELNVARKLIECKASVDAKADGGETPLHYAAKLGYVSLGRLLLKADASKDSQTHKGWSALHFAAANGNRKFIEMLCEMHADKESINELKQTPLHVAAAMGQAEAVKVLLVANANKECADYQGSTPLHLATKYNKSEVVEILLVAGANPRARNDERLTPLHISAAIGATNIIKILHLYDNELINTIGVYGNFPLHAAIESNQVKAADLLIELGANLQATNMFGFSPLHVAAQQGSAGLVKKLLEVGADVNAKGNRGVTPLFLAVEGNNNQAVVKLLLDYGANIKDECRSLTPAHMAAAKGHTEILKLLMPKYNKEEIENWPSDTPLHLAAKYGHKLAVSYLLNQGFNRYRRNSDGYTPSQLALENNHESIAEYIDTFDDNNTILVNNSVSSEQDVEKDYEELFLFKFLYDSALQSGDIITAMSFKDKIENKLQEMEEKAAFVKDDDATTIRPLDEDNNQEITPLSPSNSAHALIIQEHLDDEHDIEDELPHLEQTNQLIKVNQSEKHVLTAMLAQANKAVKIMPLQVEEAEIAVIVTDSQVKVKQGNSLFSAFSSNPSESTMDLVSDLKPVTLESMTTIEEKIPKTSSNNFSEQKPAFGVIQKFYVNRKTQNSIDDLSDKINGLLKDGFRFEIKQINHKQLNIYISTSDSKSVNAEQLTFRPLINLLLQADGVSSCNFDEESIKVVTQQGYYTLLVQRQLQEILEQFIQSSHKKKLLL